MPNNQNTIKRGGIMRLKEIKTYQAVNFQNQLETFFSLAVARMSDIKMEETSWGVRITTQKDDVIVSYNNIAYAKPLVETSEQPKEKKSKAL